MADKKISQLTTLAQADVAVTADFLPIVDTSATETKKATPQSVVLGALGATSANVGIGTASPGYRLDVVDAGGNALRFGTSTVQMGGFVSAGLPYFGTISNHSLALMTNSVERMRLDSSGNLGIGTSSPGSRLQVSATSPTRGISAIFTGTGATGTQIQLTQGGVDDWAFGQPANVSAFAIWSGRATGSDGNERMRLDSSGNLGIGTSSPGAKLEVYGGASGTVTNTQIGNASTAFVLGVDSGNNCQIRTAQNVPIIFYTNATRRASIEASGSIVAGSGAAALATTATDGFLYVPTCAGTPTGTPTAITGMAPIVVNTTNNKLYFYSGGAWRDAGP